MFFILHTAHTHILSSIILGHMEHAMGGPPIAKLDRDVLWQIFALNAVIEELPEGVYTYNDLLRRSPLTTARHTSQVCASWGQLIIGSPSLWGSILDLEFLNQKSDTWRKEVLLRTGNSELSISGDIFHHDDDGIAEFFELLLCKEPLDQDREDRCWDH